jgi:hypothetical protein
LISKKNYVPLWFRISLAVLCSFAALGVIAFFCNAKFRQVDAELCKENIQSRFNPKISNQRSVFSNQLTFISTNPTLKLKL